MTIVVVKKSQANINLSANKWQTCEKNNKMSETSEKRVTTPSPQNVLTMSLNGLT